MILSGSILFGCGAIAHNYYGEGAIAIGCILMAIGTVSVFFFEATNLWSALRNIMKTPLTESKVNKKQDPTSGPS